MGFPATVVGASRPHPAETQNGDGWSAAWFGGTCRIAVVDGLGHGPEAAAVAQTALAAIARVAEAPPLEALHACHSALAGSRGAAATIAALDLDRRQVQYAGVGNVEARVWAGARYKAFLPARGILGYRWPSSIQAWQEPLGPDWLLLLYSDGLEHRSLPAERLMIDGDPQAVLDGLLARGARSHDDATVVGAWEGSA